MSVPQILNTNSIHKNNHEASADAIVNASLEKCDAIGKQNGNKKLAIASIENENFDFRWSAIQFRV